MTYLDGNPKGHSNYKSNSSLLVGKAAQAAISSSRLDLNLNLNVAMEIIMKIESNGQPGSIKK